MTKPPALPGRRRLPAGGTPPRDVFAGMANTGRLITVRLDQVDPNPDQPRKHFDEERLQALAESIKSRGLMQPPLVRPTDDGRWQLVAGERRVRASKLAGLTEIEVLQDQNKDDLSRALLAVLENTAREDLTPMETARAYSSLVDDLGLTQEEVAATAGVSRSSVANHIRLLDLPDRATDLIDAGDLTFAHGRALLLAGEGDRTELATQAAADGWTTRELERRARAAREPDAPRRANQLDPALVRAAQALQDRIGGGWTVTARKGGGVNIAINATSIDEATKLVDTITDCSARNNDGAEPLKVL